MGIARSAYYDSPEKAVDDTSTVEAKALCSYSASYPAALKKFRHSLMEKRSQMSPSV
jgi:hypothetical protein